MISKSMLPEFDHEMSNTRRTIERVPEDKFAWKPHPKSMPLGSLAQHLATIPEWTVETIAKDSINLDTLTPLAPCENRQQLLDLFDKHVSAARASLTGASDETLLKPWSLIAGGHTLFTMPKVAVLRAFVLNHAIHHRAQLGVYLRMHDIPVPALYGPSADER